jgi:hypothetical protein
MNRSAAHGFEFGKNPQTVILKVSDQDARIEGSQRRTRQHFPIRAATNEQA